MNCFQRCIAGIGFFAITGLAHGTVVTNLEDVTNGGGFFGVVTFDDIAANTVRITADIRDPINAGLTKGDILGLWFDFAAIGSLSGGAAFVPLVVEAVFAVDSVGTQPFFDNNVNINGTGADNWDLAVQVGENGADGGFVQMLFFDLTITGLDEQQFQNQRVGMRVQSIEGADDFSFGSSKLLDTGPPSLVPEPGTLGLLGAGFLGLGFARRKRPV